MARYDKKARKKRVRYSIEPKIRKQPKIIQSPPSDAVAKFIWRVNDKYIDYNYSELGWCNCNSVDLLKDVIQELQSYEGLTWQKVREKSRHNHSWEFHEIPRVLRDRLKEIELDYLPELYQISLASLPRIWGFKDIAVFFLIWYDPHHGEYKTRAK